MTTKKEPAYVAAKRRRDAAYRKGFADGQAALQGEINVYKGKAISRGRLLERFRSHVRDICDHAADEGDRAYFGSTNHLDYLRSIAEEMEAWNWDAIARETNETDPYADAREQRARADAAEAEVRRLKSDRGYIIGFNDGWQAAEDDDRCPVCDVDFKPEDICATDIEMGVCHAACLEGSPVVDLNTGEPSDGPIDTYRYAAAPAKGGGQ